MATIHRLASAPGLLDRGADGHQAREPYSWETVYAPGTRREIGVLARSGLVVVLFVNASAAKRDLGENRNSLVEVFEQIVLDPTFRSSNPHLPACDRPQIFTPYIDRLVRDHELGWRLFNIGRRAAAVFVIAGKDPLDSISTDAENRWMMYAWESASSKTGTVSRLTNGSLNLYRAGRHGGPEWSLPRGYRWEHTLIGDNKWRRFSETDDHSCVPHIPEPDPESWWEVEKIIATAKDEEVTTWKELASRLGRVGLTARGMDERGVPLHELADPTSAVKLLLDPDKLDAYATGELRYEQVGPGNGMWTLPSGHRFLPRWEGDEQGSIEYSVQLGKPPWPVGFTVDDLDDIKKKWWPEGKAKAEPPTRRSSDQPCRALAGLVQWADKTHRYEVFSHGNRYELRKQALAEARRRADGETADLRHEDTKLVASWLESELAEHVARLLDTATEQLLSDRPDATLATAVVTPAAVGVRPADARDLHLQAVQRLRDQATSKLEQSRGAAELSNMLAARADPDGALAKHEEAAALRAEAADLEGQAEELEQYLPAAAPNILRVEPGLDLSTPAALVAALAGPHGRGPQPAILNRTLERYFPRPGDLQLTPVPDEPLRMALTGTVTFTLTDGTTVELPASLSIPAKVSATNADVRIEQLARSYMWDGLSLDAVAVIGRSRNVDVLKRQLAEYMGAGERHPNPKARKSVTWSGAGARIRHRTLRAAAIDAPLETRQILWAAQTGVSVPPSLPRGFDQHIRHVYLGSTGGTSWRSGWLRNVPVRYEAVAVLSSHPALQAQGMRTDHLAACLGATVRELNEISRHRKVGQRTEAPTLARPTHWTQSSAPLEAEEKLVQLMTCQHRRRGGPGLCGGLLTAILITPEVAATGNSTLCTTCRRPPGGNLVFPASYIDRAHEQLRQHQGSWVPCAYSACLVDFGAGPGLMWRNNHTSGPVWHGPDCQAHRSVPTDTAPRLRMCARPLCFVDEGYGPGMIANHGRATRRWHNGDCQDATVRAERALAAKRKPASPCAYQDCTVDEGAGPGLLDPERSRSSRRWHSRVCKTAATRAADGELPAGTIRWSSCGDPSCSFDEGGGPGQVGNVVGAVGRTRRHHNQACGRRSRGAR